MAARAALKGALEDFAHFISIVDGSAIVVVNTPLPGHGSLKIANNREIN